MTDTAPLTDQQLDAIRQRANVEGSDEIKSLQIINLKHDLRALLAEIDRLRGELAREQRAHSQTINERDHTHDAADRLAQAIAPIDVIGEHSGMNDPWQNAIEEARRLRAELAATRATCDASSTSPLGNNLIGPCVLRLGHDGPMHKTADGCTWGHTDRDAAGSTT